jgi:hypothetical protein
VASWVASSAVLGTSGYSGYSGISGVNGTGTSGYSGYSGISGVNGASGYSGYSGISGATGTGTSGYSGYSGISGVNGASGYSGYSGISGVTGASGYSGYSGISGSTGSSAKTFTWVIAAPTTGVILGPRLNASATPSSVYAYVSNATNVVFNIYHGAVGSTTNLLTSNLTATTSESSTSGFSGTLASGDWMMLNIVSVSGTPGQLTATIAVT